MMKKLLVVLVSGIFLVSSFGCRRHIRERGLDNPYKGKVIYTTVNMRYDGVRNKGSYIAYEELLPPPLVSSALLPVNSKVRIIEVKSGVFTMEIPTGQVIHVVYKEAWGGKPINEIMPFIFSEADISAELSQFNEIEMRGIKIGKALVGMSKKAVIVALGYPPAHVTPSTDQNIWTYWRNRFDTYQVEFKDGKVITVGGEGR